MDRVAETVGINPIELRILNSYRDGDTKAHRRLAKNTALIECCQVAAQKAAWPISVDAAAQSSRVGGGVGVRGVIPESVTDEDGRIGERPAGRSEGTAPSMRGTGRVSAGTCVEAKTEAHMQNPDMALEADRIGHRMGSAPSTTPAPSAAPAIPIASPAAAAPPPPQPTVPVPPAPAPQAQPAAPTPPPAAPEPYKPEQPFQRGLNRPGTSRFTSGIRRR